MASSFITFIRNFLNSYVSLYEFIRDSEFSLVFLIPLVLLVILLYPKIKTRFEYAVLRERLRVKPKKESMVSRIRKKAMKTRANRIIDYFARKVLVTNGSSLDRNREYAIYLILVLTVSFVVLLIFSLKNSSIWYQVLINLGFSIIIGGIGTSLYFAHKRHQMLSNLPNTFKLINSRYSTEGKILKAVQVSLDDFAPAVKREMERIVDALNLNRKSEIDDIFQQIDFTYQDEFFSLLLELIQKAHYQGDAQVVKEQFEELTDEILDEIENQRNIAAVSRGFMAFVVITIPALMQIFKAVTYEGLGEFVANTFYTSPYGITLEIGIYGAAIGLIGIIYYMEKSA